MFDRMESAPAGRPAIGGRRAIRMPDELVARVDDWAKTYGGGCSRSEAVRQLLDRALAIFDADTTPERRGP